MNKKKIWMILPMVLLPYLTLFALAIILFSAKCAFFEYIMVSIFHGNACNLIAALLLYYIIAALFSIVCFIAGIRKGWNALPLAKSAMLVKLIHAPAYVLIFILGVLLASTIFTIPFSVGLFLLDCLTLFLSGLLTTASIMNAIRQGVFKCKDIFWFFILQFVFCADVVASIVFYLKLKEKYNTDKNV